MHNQSIAGSTLPDLSEAAEQEKGESFFSLVWSTQEGDSCQHFAKGGHFLDLWEKNCSIYKKVDDLFLCFCSSMPPISWAYLNRELIHLPSADSSVVKVEPKKKTPVGIRGYGALLKFAWLIKSWHLSLVYAFRCFSQHEH